TGAQRDIGCDGSIGSYLQIFLRVDLEATLACGQVIGRRGQSWENVCAAGSGSGLNGKPRGRLDGRYFRAGNDCTGRIRYGATDASESLSSQSPRDCEHEQANCCQADVEFQVRSHRLRLHRGLLNLWSAERALKLLS